MANRDHDLLLEIKGEVKNLIENFKKWENEKVQYITRVEFSPVRNIAFAIVGTMGTGVLLAILASIITKIS